MTSNPAASTATDTLRRKSADSGIVSGGRLVAKALRSEGVDTIFTLCGGHIIDIYDGCIDEGIRIVDVRHEQVAAHAADGYARQTGKLGCVVTTAGPGCTNAVTGIATAFRSESPILHIGGQSSLGQHKQGSLQDLPHVDIMTPITKFASGVFSTERIADMISMAARECFAGAYGPSYLEIPRDILDREIPLESAVIPEPGRYPRLAQRPLRFCGHRAPRGVPRPVRAPGRSFRPAGLGVRSGGGSHCVRARSRHSLLHERRQPRHAAARRSASLRPHTAAGLQGGGCPSDCRNSLRLPHGLRKADLQGPDAGPDRSRLPHGGQEPRHRSRTARTSRSDPERRGRCCFRRAGRWQAPDAPAMDGETPGSRGCGAGEADAALQVRPLPDPSVPACLGDQRVPRGGHHLYWRRGRRGDHFGAGCASPRARPVDGPLAPSGRSASAPASPWPRSSPIRKRR